MTNRRFYAPNAADGLQELDLSEEESRHLKDVLRLRVGDSLNIFDGAGNEFRADIASIGKKTTRLSQLAKAEPTAPESRLDLRLAVTLLKGEKLDPVIQKAVELGVSSVTPITSVRCDVRSKDSEKRIERWRRIAIEATKQCGRAKLMSVEPLTSFQTLIESERDDATVRILFSERDGETFDNIGASRRIFAFFGPEGGWDDSELALSEEKGFQRITFGGRIMKADTAAVAISAILQHKFGDIN